MMLIFISACTSGSKQTENTETAAQSADPTWNSRMQELRLTLMELGPFIFDDKKFNDPKNFETIKSGTKKLENLAHDLTPSQEKMLTAPTSDPMMKYLASEFKENLDRAYESLNANHTEYARSVLKTSLSYCISCHTRSDAGPKYPLFDNPAFVSELQPMEQANYYVATRQYDAALKKYMDILRDTKTASRRPFDIERAARSALAIAVRVNKNPNEALEIAKYVNQKPETPLFVRNDSVTWIESIQDWKKQPKALPLAEEAYIARIKTLLKKADNVRRYRVDMRGDIYHLQATALIHDYFNQFENPKSRGEVFYLAGQAYEPLRELGFWTLHEMYYERCIREIPHTSIARKCYENLEQSILLGYSGSAGIFVPRSVQQQLKELYRLSTPK